MNVFLYHVLIAIRDNPSDRIQSEGICNNVFEQARQVRPIWEAIKAREQCEKLCDKYPEKSPDYTFPVVGGWEAYVHARHYSTMWTGEYGEARLKLLDWLLEELNKKVNANDTKQSHR